MNKTDLSTFWITNISDRDVSVSDLNISIKSMTSVNLLDVKHYPHLTLSLLQQSEQSGSLFKKRDKLYHRKVAPPHTKAEHIQVHLEAYIPTRQHSDLEIVHTKYEELNIDDDALLNNITDIPLPISKSKEPQ